MVVTLQDMTPLEDLERMRAEFLGMVSHELRAPLTSIKGSAATVLGSSADMDPAVVRQFFRIIDEQANHMHDLVADYGRDELIARAFDMGAVDYVVKPFSPTELAARIRAALRKRAASEPSDPYVLGDLAIDYAERSVTFAGRPLPLIAMEYRLLAELSANAGAALTYEHLLERVWGEKSSGDVRPMRTIVSKLRRKLGDDADNPTYIFTEPRVGYRMPRGRDQERRQCNGQGKLPAKPH